MTVETFILDHYRAIAGDEHLAAACLSQVSGPAFTLIEGGQILAIGGVRVQGIGQAWFMMGPDGTAHTKSVLRAVRAGIEQSIKQEKLYRLYAEVTVDKPAFLKHLGFHQQNNIFVR